MIKKGYKSCPYCAEPIRAEAIKCRYCQTMLTQPLATPEINIPPSITQFPQHEHLEIQRLARFVPTRVMEGILTGSEMMDEGERRNITILFADLAGFTPLAETLDPEDLKDLIDHYLGELTEIITKYDGTIDKFVGDAVMALFGAPSAHEDDPERALRSAMEMQEAMKRMGEKYQRDLKLRVGISCGDVIVGGLGGKGRLDYTAIGDVVNLANRLQSKGEPGQILVSKRIFERTQHSFDFLALGVVELKGKTEPVPIYHLTRSKREYDKVPMRSVSAHELVGRNTEMRLLKEMVSNAKAGQLVVVHIKGEAGVGKSRLMYELQKMAPELDVQFYYGRCLSYGKTSSYHPFIDLLIRGICQVPDNLPKDAAAIKVNEVLMKLSPELRSYIPYIQYLVSPEIAPQSLVNEDPKVRMQRIFNAVQSVLEKYAHQKTIILELEDIQWADELSLQLLMHLISSLNNVPIVIFLVYRPYFTFTPPRVTGGKQITLELQELSDKDSEKLIHHLLGLKNLPDGFIEKIMQKTEGNPFYAEEVILFLEQTGTLVSTEDGWTLTKQIQELEIPDTVQGVVLSRIDRLESKVRRVLQCASVIGHRFRYRLLNYVMEVERDLEIQLARLMDNGLILEQSIIPELEYLFRHSVTQEVTYNTLLVKRRKHFHGKIAQCLESIYSDRLDEHFELIAHHYIFSDNQDSALIYAIKAADKCKKLFANEAALDFYTEALKRVKYYTGTPDEVVEMEITLFLNRGIVSELVGEIKPALEDYLKAVELSKRLKKDTHIIHAHQNTGEIYRQQGQYQKALKYTQIANQLSRKNNNKLEELNCTNRLAVIYRDLGKYKRALQYFKKVLLLSRSQKNLFLMAHAYNNLGLIYWSYGKYGEAVNYIQKALNLRVELGDKKGQVAAYNNLGILYEKMGKLDDTLSAYGDCIRLAREIGYKKGEVAGKSNIGWIYWIQGKDLEAFTAFEYVLEESENMGDTQSQAITYCNIGYIYTFQGKYDRAFESFQKGLNLAVESQDHYPEIVLLNGLFELQIRSHKWNDAEGIMKNLAVKIKKFKDEESTTTTYRLMAEFHLSKKKYGIALIFAQKAYQLSHHHGNLRDMAWSSLTLAKILKKLKRDKKSSALLKKSEHIALQLSDVHCLEEIRKNPFD